MRITFLLIFTIVNLSVFAQDNNFKLPELAVPSPQAYELTKYGDIPVDESSGRISPSIPLHNFQVGAINVPISLSYNGGGVKVNQNPTWTGISWSINAGGVITRVVKDLPDETQKQRFFYSKEELDSFAYYDSSQPFVHMMLPQNIINLGYLPNEYDTQVDEFNFSFPGYSGTFVLYKNEAGEFNAKVLKNDSNLKIEILGDFSMESNFEFKITTMDGTRYFFGGLVADIGVSPECIGFAYEETQLIDRSQSSPFFGVRAKTAFYLTKIENHLGDKVNFEYFTVAEYNQFFLKEQKLLMKIATDENYEFNCSGNGINNDLSNFTSVQKNNIYNGKFLKRIWSPQSINSISFNSSEVFETLQGGGNNLKYRVLTDIDFGYEKISFNYFPSINIIQNGNTDKFFLTEVNFKDSSNSLLNKKYSFEYNDLGSIPGFYSNAQDYLGFYNGKSNNSLLPRGARKYLKKYFGEIGIDISIPQIENVLNISNFSVYDQYLADREPSFNHANNGLLEKINYPTGGYTVFEYEPEEKKILYGNKSLSIHSNMGLADPAWTLNSKLSSQLTISGLEIDENGNQINEDVFQSQSIIVDVDINTLSGNNLDYRDYVYVQIIDNTNNNIVEKKYHFPSTVTNTNNQQTNFKTSLAFSLIKNRDYSFKIGFGDIYSGHIVNSGGQNNTNQFSPTPMYVNASFQYIKGYDENDGLGIRIKRVKDYANSTSNPVIKRYYYNKITNINDESEAVTKLYTPLFYGYKMAPTSCLAENGTETSVMDYYLSLHSNSFSQGLASSDVNNIYNVVTISNGGDNFENGGVEKYFLVSKDIRLKHYNPNGDAAFMNNYVYQVFKNLEFDISSKTNRGVANGLLTRETFWKKKNNLLHKIKDIKKTYVLQEDFLINNIKTEIVYQSWNFSFGNIFFGLYKTYSFKPLLIEIKEVDFVDEVPITSYLPPVIDHGWQFEDEDGDGIMNGEDPNFFNRDESYVEENFRKYIVETAYDYFLPVMPELPTIITTTNSIGEISTTRNYYPIENDINSLSSEVSALDVFSYNILKNQNRISKPIQVVNSKNNIVLSKLRILYTFFEEPLASAFEYKIQSSKGNSDFEDRIIYNKYDERGNPVEIFQADGTKVVYIWSFQSKPLYKIINATYNEVISALTSSGIEIDENFTGSSTSVSLSTHLPNAQVFTYTYVPALNLINSVEDPKGDMIFYHYDEFNRLQFIKDKDGNILNENEYHYKN